MTKQTFTNVALVLRLALNATARACGQKRGFARRVLDSTQDKSCSVALLGLAFTMAEILLSLTIIGVVAAITLPSLTGNINERTWNTQRKALYARMSQAIALMPSLNGYGTYVAEVKDANGSITTSGQDTVAETFITAGLSKVLKINNICDNQNLKDCGIAEDFTILTGNSKYSFPKTMTDFNIFASALDTKTVAFETQNGESIVAMYNPNCVSKDLENFVEMYMCTNFIYDLNGTKGPNTVGKDIGFMTVFYPSDSEIVHPLPPFKEINGTISGLSGICRSYEENSRVVTLQELMAIKINMNAFGIGVSSTPGTYVSATRNENGHRGVDFADGRLFDNVDQDVDSMCVMRY